MRESKWTKEEVIEHIENGWKLYYDKRNDKYKLRKYENGKDRFLTLPKSLNDFCRSLIEMKENEREESEEQGEERREKRKEKREKREEKGGETAGTGRKHTLEALDKSHAEIVRRVTERVSWFADVLDEIGFYATIIAMQYAKVKPDELYDRVVEFKDPEEFSKFVKDQLNALFQAKEDARALMELRNKLNAMDIKLCLIQEAYDHVVRQKDELARMVQDMISLMCEDCLREYYRREFMVKFGQAIMMRGGEKGGAGRADSESNSEEERDSGRGSEIVA